MAKTTVRKTGEQFIFWWWTFLETNREMSFKNLTWTGMSPMICKANFLYKKLCVQAFPGSSQILPPLGNLDLALLCKCPSNRYLEPRNLAERTNDKLSQPPPWPTPAFLVRAANKLQPAVVRRGICRKSHWHWHLCKIFLGCGKIFKN